MEYHRTVSQLNLFQPLPLRKENSSPQPLVPHGIFLQIVFSSLAIYSRSFRFSIALALSLRGLKPSTINKIVGNDF